MYGTQTARSNGCCKWWFESDVKMYGTQTECRRWLVQSPFESDVKMYGTQTRIDFVKLCMCLRVM